MVSFDGLRRISGKHAIKHVVHSLKLFFYLFPFLTGEIGET
jgi:hypothetical protein